MLPLLLSRLRDGSNAGGGGSLPDNALVDDDLEALVDDDGEILVDDG